VKPQKIQLHKISKQLELVFNTNQRYLLSAEYLRVLSPSAEVRGHHPNQATLQFGKKDIGITSIASVGNYAIQIFFDDQHDSGIYSWEYLHQLCVKHDDYWQSYLAQLKRSNKCREANVDIIKF
tara:strand:+ start:916 stop:1287 length:372 start_codon:yes stop_codon:yes gene_type:complete